MIIGMGSLDELLARRDRKHARRLAERAAAAIRDLRSRGVDVHLIGSVAHGTAKAHSDVDFVIVERGPLSHGQIMLIIESHLQECPYDMVFLQDLTAEARARFNEFVARA